METCDEGSATQGQGKRVFRITGDTNLQAVRKLSWKGASAPNRAGLRSAGHAASTCCHASHDVGKEAGETRSDSLGKRAGLRSRPKTVVAGSVSEPVAFKAASSLAASTQWTSHAGNAGS